MTLKGRAVSWVAALAAFAQTGWGQPASPWRIFKIADGLPEPACASVTVTPQGMVLARHLNVASITRLDGYTATIIPAPPKGPGRCQESPAGQLWAAAPDGLYEFKNDAWLFHAVPEIAAESAAAPVGASQALPLCPVRQGRVLFLLRDRLMAFNADDPETARIEILRRASQTRLSVFLGMTPARDGGLWLSGARGLAKLPAPLRNLRADSEWQEFEPIIQETIDGASAASANVGSRVDSSAAPRVENLRSPREDETAGVTMLADSSDARGPVVVHFDGQRWTLLAKGIEHIRFAWNGPGPTPWVAAENALFQWRGKQGPFAAEDEVSVRRVFDMATEPGGAFWLATSDGLFHYSPAIWQSPAALQGLRVPVSCIAEDIEGRVWFVAAGGLCSFHGAEYQTVILPDSARRSLQAVRSLVALANGTLLLVTGDQLFRFHPATGDFALVAAQSGKDQPTFLGLLRPGVAGVQRGNPDAATPDYRLESFDGVQLKPYPVASPIPVLGPTLLALFQARGGDLWLSGEQGVACLRGSQWRTYFAANRGAPAAARFFAETADGRIWCATSDELWTFDARNWTPVRAAFDHINALTRSGDDDLWVASDGGLHRFTSAGWIEHGIEEGLAGVTVRGVCEDRRGRLWAATSQGLSRYHPMADLDPPKSEILPIAEQHIEEGGSLTLVFEALDKWKITPRKRLLFSHRLDDRDWSAFQETSTATLVDLAAGKHSFQVRAMDRCGNIELKPAHLAFEVALPWFKETRLIVITSLGAIAALFFAALAFNRHLRLRRSSAEVERKVAERTRELEMAGRELLHSQKMNALGTLAAGIAHDFNSILSIVKGSAQIIEDNLDNPVKIQTRLDRIKIVVEQGAGIVQAMLGFSRSSDGAVEPCDLNAIVDSTITLLGDRFLEDVEVRFDRASGLPQVSVPRDLVQQVLLNFIFNAAESMHERKQIVLGTARLERLAAGLVLRPAETDNYVCISVRDIGCGIPPENLPRIFEPFFTTKALSSRRGTGLGLSMVYQLAERMHAGLAVASVVNQGSTFTLILPLTPGTP